MNDQPHVFSVVSKADLGLKEYILDAEGFGHIMLGHRDLRCFVSGIQETVENPTHVYRSSYNIKRFQFVSYNVLSKSGHPMNVVIEAADLHGRVVTATPKNSISGNIVWDAETGIYASYDRRSDILYFSSGDSRPSYAIDDVQNERIWLRRHEDDDTPAGITIFDASATVKGDKDRLTVLVASFLKVSPGDVALRLNSIIR